MGETVAVKDAANTIDISHPYFLSTSDSPGMSLINTIGGFPEDMEISVSKLIRLWIAEQFVRGRSTKRLELVAEEYLQELIDRSLLLAGRQRANGRTKTCKIHDLLRQLCLREAHTQNVVHIMNENVPQAIEDQRRVILVSDLEEKQVYPARHSSGITRTFISVPSFPKEIFSIVPDLKLLKVLDVLSVWYDFSWVVPQLVHLRYVAARIMKTLSLAKLRNLQTIILVGSPIVWVKHDTIDIWRMPEIRHVDIPRQLFICNPLEAENNIGEQPLLLNNLHTLTLRNSPFVTEIIRRTPNLKKLKISPSEYIEWTDILGSLNLLEDLETLQIEAEAEATIYQVIFSGDSFPPNLKDLRLVCIKIPWEVVNLLANLPNLEVLRGSSAFAGTEWKLNEDVVFHKLKYLRIIGGAGSDNFPMLEQLILYELVEPEEIPESIGEIMTLKFIKIVDCSSGVETSARKIQQEQQSWGNYDLQLQITSME